MLSSIKVRRSAAVTGVAAAALVALAACGSSSSGSSGGGGGGGSTTKDTPVQAAQAGFTGLAGSNAETLTLKVSASSSDLVALSKDDGDTSGALTDAQAAAITGGSVVIAAKSGGSSFSDDAKKGDQSGEQVALTVNAGSAPDLFQLVVANKTIYARADVAKGAALAGADTTQLNTIAAEVPAQYAFVKDAIAGKWLKIDETQLTSLAKQGSPSGVPSVAPSQYAALEAAFQKIFTTDVTVTRDAADPTLGDHLVLKGNARTIGTDLISASKTTLSSIPGASTAFADADPASIPDKDVTVDEYVKDGKLSAIKLDLRQFFNAADAAAAKGPVALEVDFADGATVTPPTTATTVDLSGLGGLLGGLGGGL